MFPTQGLNPHLLRLLHYRQILYVESPGKFKLHVYICLLYIYKCCCSVTKLCLTLCNPVDAAHKAPLSSTISQSLLKSVSVELVMLTNHLTLCCLLLHLLSVFPNIRAFSSESALPTRWPKYWSFGFSISPSNEHSHVIFLSHDADSHQRNLSSVLLFLLFSGSFILL